MKTSLSIPTTTKKWHIEVPTNKFESIPTIFLVWFGKKFLIWKGKSLLQSCESLAESIERYLRRGISNPEDQMHHVCSHIKKTRCIRAYVEVLDNQFLKDTAGGSSINGYRMLVEEQGLLDKHRNNPQCLNNNVQAYIPMWIGKAHEEKFMEFYGRKERT